MLRFRSITSRLIFLHVVVLFIAAIFIPLVLFWFLDSDVDKLQQRALQQQAESIAKHLIERPDGKLHLDLPESLRDQYSAAYGRYSYTVFDERGNILLSSQSQGSQLVKFEKHLGELKYFELINKQHNIIGASLQQQVGAHCIYLQVIEDLNHRDVLVDDLVSDFFRRAAVTITPILLLLLIIDILIFRRTMQPIVHASNQARQISPTRIGLRLDTKNIPDEIASLVSAVNQALDRLELGFRRQQEFAADAAHELRTPLAILRARAESLPDSPVSREFLQDIENMTRTVGQLLDAAEIESMVIGPHEVADLQAISREIAEFIVPLALAEKRSISLVGTDVPVLVKGNAEMLRRAIRNIVENAIKHTPAGTSVEIDVGAEGMVSIVDTGEGIAVDERERIFERRLKANTNRRSNDGAGLGLSIVKQIVEAHEGTIKVESTAGGGARFTMSIPLAA